MASSERDHLPTCAPGHVLSAASRGLDLTSRRAVRPRGHCGSLYDVVTDTVLDRSIGNLHIQHLVSSNSLGWVVKPYQVGASFNLLEMIKMHHELRLNIALGVTPATGVGALINYSRPIDRYTRFITYSLLSRTEYLPNDEIHRLRQSKPFLSDACMNATHIIILANYGIDVVVVIQLPRDEALVSRIDDYLIQGCAVLTDNNISDSWISDAEETLRHIESTTIFSNVPALTEIQTITDFYRQISSFKDIRNAHPPYNYHLCPIYNLYTVSNQSQATFQTMELKDIESIEYYILTMKNHLRGMKREVDTDYPFFRKYMRELLSYVTNEWIMLKEMCSKESERVRKWLQDFRCGAGDLKTVHNMLDGEKAKALQNRMIKLSTDLEDIRKKERFISEILPKELHYRNAADFGGKEVDERTVQQKLMDGDKEIRILCGTDDLYRENSSEWNAILQKVIDDRKQNPSARWIYSDFSYCTKKPERLKILPAIKKENNIPAPQQRSTKPEPAKQEDIFNVLLIGESGVGKSTFINAFVNYLQFDSFQKAQENTPIVLLPISFIITYGSAFKEQRVAYDGLDKSSNEDHEHPGQSVTQHCKSYLFTLTDEKYRGRQMRLIDTPGIGDARGTEQDDRNMQDILAFVNTLTHLHAICIVMKPNVTRLNVVFRSCLIQLLDLLGEKARDHILFCFTNTRATFYGPGDTAPVLRKLLTSLPGASVPFGRANSFCFDSESFRYLVAKKQGVRFESDQIEQYEVSWKKSSDESSRLFERVSHGTTAYQIDPNHQSRINATLKINLMLPPILEAMRNILRNIVLSKAKSPQAFIELCPQVIQGQKYICSRCTDDWQLHGDFWIKIDPLHDVSTTCRTCSCAADKHTAVHYQLQFKRSGHPSKQFQDVPSETYEDQLKTILSDLCLASAVFALFLSNGIYVSQRDPILSKLDRMIDEEIYICKKKRSAHANEALLVRLEALKIDYQASVSKKATENAKRTDDSYIYGCIDRISEYEIIASQMVAVRQWQATVLESSEFKVPA